ncbi:3-dehydroquinate synthase [Myxococcota bacterium]|nr:3-dehydroquinate synthase [Myxococcota bacterium]MBU1381151.1 3-dehydroquinate synthase [Myxococcota bacterium]MBU1496723.1 3-dehydroquinate synthase [Myxococcota bacterium]
MKLISQNKYHQEHNTAFFSGSYNGTKDCIKNSDFVICDHNVYFLHKELIDNKDYFLLKGEEDKNFSVVEILCEEMMKSSLSRKSTVACIGGGSVLDTAGLACSMYHRGLKALFFPTTVLAVCDASIGGKNAVNLSNRKNMAGSWYFPEKIIFYPGFLKTLPAIQHMEGFIETIKHGLLENEDLLKNINAFLKQNYPGENDPVTINDSYLNILIQSALYKIKITSEDPFEKGNRLRLNAGHTIGHALETSAGLSHGRAVAIGLIIEHSILKELTGKDIFLPSNFFPESLFKDLALPDPYTILQHAISDKKNLNTCLRFSSPSYVSPDPILEASEDLVLRKIMEFQNDLPQWQRKHP